MPLAIILDWYGPYNSYQDLKDELKYWGKVKTMYMAVNLDNIPTYIGLTTSPSTRHNNQHKMNNLDETSHRFYCAEIVSQGVAGKKSNFQPPDLRLAEQLLISYFEPKHNKIFKNRYPEDSVSLFSRFFDSLTGEDPKKPLKNFPVLLGFNDYTEEFWKSKNKPQ